MSRLPNLLLYAICVTYLRRIGLATIIVVSCLLSSFPKANASPPNIPNLDYFEFQTNPVLFSITSVDENLWITNWQNSSVDRFNTKSKKFEVFFWSADIDIINNLPTEKLIDKKYILHNQINNLPLILQDVNVIPINRPEFKRTIFAGDEIS